MEIFACNYGLNEAFGDQIRSNALRVSGYGEDGTVRMVELPGHPFFISTLFVPQMTSESGKPHPLIVGYLLRFRQWGRAVIESPAELAAPNHH